MSTDDLISQSEAARELGCTFKAVTKMVAAGKLGPVTERVGRNKAIGKFVSRAAVEALAGKKADAGDDLPQPKAHPLDPWTQPLAPLDLVAINRAAYEMRDKEWSRYLIAKGIDVAGPKLPSVLAADLAANRFFTRAQVYELLARSVRAAYAEWQEWLADPLYRAQFPNGPKPLDPSDIGEEK